MRNNITETDSDGGVLIHRSIPFVAVPKPALNEPRISWRAKGILAYLLGKPDGWKVRVTDICNHATEGVTAVRTALDELRRFGYIKLTQARVAGKFGAWTWEVFSTPYKSDGYDDDGDDLTNTGNPNSVLPDSGRPYVSNNDCTNNDCTNNDKKEEEEVPPRLPDEVLLWNSKGLPKVLNFGPQRTQKLRTRLGCDFFRANFAAAMNKVLASDFCMGKNDRGWKATFEWMLLPDTVTKIMEGKYDNRKASVPAVRPPMTAETFWPAGV